MKLIKKILIDLIPGLMFTFATLVTSQSFAQQSFAHNDIYAIVGLVLYIISYCSLDLHTYLINKLNNKK